MEMTRQRAAESLASTHLLPCPHCHGKGVIKSPMTMSVELQRALHSVMRKYQDNVHEVKVIVHPDLLNRLRTEDEEHLVDIERRYAGRLSFRPDSDLPPGEVRDPERPFRRGAQALGSPLTRSFQAAEGR